MQRARRRALCWLALIGAVMAAPAAAFEGLSGAVTGVVLWGPEYKGAAASNAAFRPGLLLRYQRVTVSSGAGFAARREDADLRGLGVDLTRSEVVRVNLGLRVDGGRQETASPALVGMGDVKRTLRARIGATWRFAPDWQAAASWTIDAFNRGGGNVADARIQYDWHLSPRIVLTPSAIVTVAGPRYMKTWFGVNEEQSARTGYPVYQPGMGVRDLGLNLSLRAELGEDWVVVAGPGYARLLGPAARSPIVQRRSSWSASAGVGYRF